MTIFFFWAAVVVLWIVLIYVFHLYTFFTEAEALNAWSSKVAQTALFFLFLVTGSLFIYFVRPSALKKGLIQLMLIICGFLILFIMNEIG